MGSGLASYRRYSPCRRPPTKSGEYGTSRLLGVRGALAVALLFAVLLLVLSAAPADAAFPGQGGKIAFIRDNRRKGTSGTFTVAPEGGGQQKIGPEYGYSQSWSTDGQKVVFVGTPGRMRWSSNSTST
jgi:hypothetical protein